MAARTISVVMESSYKSDLSKELRRDKQKLDEFQKYLDKRGLRIPVRIDLKGFQAQAGAMRKIVQGAFANMPSPILGSNGLPATSGNASTPPRRTPGLLSETLTTTYGKNGNPTARHLSQIEQLGSGLQRASKYKLDMVTGSPSLISEATKDVRTVRDLEDGLRGVNKQLGQAYSKASGSGDRDGQRLALTEQKRRVDALLQTGASNGLTGSGVFTKGESQSDRLAARLARLDGVSESKETKAIAARGRNRYDNALRQEEERVDRWQKANTEDIIRANQIADLTRRESELNRIYAERKKIFTDSQAKFQRMDAWRQGRGDSPGSDKAMRRALNMEGHAVQVDVEQARAMASLATHQSAARKAAEAQAATDRAAAFNREMQDIKANSDKRIAAINATERQERAATHNTKAKQAAAEKGHLARQAEYGNRSNQYAGVEARARGAGNVATADTARGKRLGAEVAATRDAARFAAATTAGGHALNFHTSSLLRNAATYTRWMIPVQAVMGMTSAFNAGVAGAIKVDRQFATLRAVFRGTDAEAQRLKVGTLELAAAQGRSADEAMDAAIRWSRLGMTRIQVLQATKVSLMAANVAEMTAAEASEKLSAIYATYRLNVGDLPVVLARLNAISNRYNVTNKDLLEGIVRVAGVAKEAGLELRDLEGMIGAVTGATGRPGQEVGNALKFVVTRLAAPETMKGLKEGFNIDLSGPNGDLKSMSQIFRELSAIYPTLNNAQKQYFLKLTAGSRQAARFALVLDQYRQSQILAAEAGFDTSSAFRENDKILASLQSRVESLSASWTKLFTAMGDAGAFDLLSSLTSGMGDTINSWSRFLAHMETGVGADKGFMQRFANAMNKRVGANFGNPYGIVKDMAVDAFHGEFMGKKNDPAKSDYSSEVERITANVNMLRERMGGLSRASNVFESMNVAIREGAIDRKTMVRDFESGAHLLINLENGSNRYADAVSRFYKLLEAGDTTGLQKLMIELQGAFQGSESSTKQQFDKAIAPAVETLRDKLAEFEKQRRQLIATPDDGTDAGKRKKAEEIEKIQAAAKAAQGEIEQLTQAQEKFNKAAYGAKPVSAINRYLDHLVGSTGDNEEERVKAQAAAFGEKLKDLSPDADNDPVGRTFQRRRNAEEIGRRWLLETQRKTNLEAATRKGPAARMIEYAKSRMAAGTITEAQGRHEIGIWQKVIDQMDEANLMIQTRLILEDKRLAKARDELAVAEQIAALTRAQTDASKAAADSSIAWRFGETDSDKNANQALTAIQRAKEGLAKAGGAWFNEPLLGENPSRRAGFAGQVLQDEATARKGLETLQTRQYEIEAARKQVAFDTVKAMREQTDEANKRLMLASREDQLRVAAMQSTLSRSGRISAGQFYGLSQESREAVVNYLPNEAPGRLNPAKEARYKALNELDSEQTRLVSAITDIRLGLEGLGAAIKTDSRAGGPLDITPSAPGKSVQEAALTRDTAPVANVNIGNVALNVQLAGQVEKILSGYVDRKLAADLSAMEARLSRPATPNAQGVAE